ncbi:MAG TPA: carboxylating nicotinate-nucleotide diphosphorylase [Candidatus Acidoferrales bacterium]|nr:carboxylating nicotinate-nucleotide diphosphorylase [Candidatus Acidoferrales bacterium]
MTATSLIAAPQTRVQRTEQALFRGASLTLGNTEYRDAVRPLLDSLLEADTAPRDITVDALRLPRKQAKADIVAREPGIAAGLEELAFLLRTSQLAVFLLVKDGTPFTAGEVLARLEGDESKLLSSERVGLNLLQRMCGIATTAHRLQGRVSRRNPESRLVATRKTPCGLLDKRAAHLGGAGTHRLGLGDAILVKNNHLAMLGPSEENAAPVAIERAWELRRESAFIEVEVRSAPAALAAAAKFRSVREQDDRSFPCFLLLDNMSPQEIARIIEALRAKNLYDDVLIEASGRITEGNIEEYAAAGADAISVGALTHSVRALDLAQKIS